LVAEELKTDLVSRGLTGLAFIERKAIKKGESMSVWELAPKCETEEDDARELQELADSFSDHSALHAMLPVGLTIPAIPDVDICGRNGYPSQFLISDRFLDWVKLHRLTNVSVIEPDAMQSFMGMRSVAVRLVQPAMQLIVLRGMSVEEAMDAMRRWGLVDPYFTVPLRERLEDFVARGCPVLGQRKKRP
jgi:hypothetical protein